MTFMQKTAVLGLVGAAAAVQPVALQAQTVTTFNMTGLMADNGPYGDVLSFLPNAGGVSSLRLQVTGWQINQSNNAVTSAWAGAYSPGTGVTGIRDSNGDNGYHQIDNALGYTDFVLLQFNAPVVLSSLNLNSFTLGSSTTKDNDLAFYAASFPAAAWNSAINLSLVGVPAAAQWTTRSGTGADGAVATGATIASREWLVGAALNSSSNDGFKISSISVVSPVPEPASWALMILGLGIVGAAARRRPPIRRFAARVTLPNRPV